jgi:hypothetical protein
MNLETFKKLESIKSRHKLAFSDREFLLKIRELLVEQEDVWGRVLGKPFREDMRACIWEIDEELEDWRVSEEE